MRKRRPHHHIDKDAEQLPEALKELLGALGGARREVAGVALCAVRDAQLGALARLGALNIRDSRVELTPRGMELIAYCAQRWAPTEAQRADAQAELERAYERWTQRQRDRGTSEH